MVVLLCCYVAICGFFLVEANFLEAKSKLARQLGTWRAPNAKLARQLKSWRAKLARAKSGFRGGSKGGQVSGLRGGRVRLKGGKGDRTRKGWGEVIRSDNLDWGLYNKKFSVWES